MLWLVSILCFTPSFGRVRAACQVFSFLCCVLCTIICLCVFLFKPWGLFSIYIIIVCLFFYVLDMALSIYFRSIIKSVRLVSVFVIPWITVLQQLTVTHMNSYTFLEIYIYICSMERFYTNMLKINSTFLTSLFVFYKFIMFLSYLSIGKKNHN